MWIEVSGWPESHIPVRQLPDIISSDDRIIIKAIQRTVDCDIGLENGLGLAVKKYQKDNLISYNYFHCDQLTGTKEISLIKLRTFISVVSFLKSL